MNCTHSFAAALSPLGAIPNAEAHEPNAWQPGGQRPDAANFIAPGRPARGAQLSRAAHQAAEGRRRPLEAPSRSRAARGQFARPERVCVVQLVQGALPAGAAAAAGAAAGARGETARDHAAQADRRHPRRLRVLAAAAGLPGAAVD